MIYLVLTDSYVNFKKWCFSKNILNDDKNFARYIHRRDQIQGLDQTRVKIIKTGDWYLNPLLRDPVYLEFEQKVLSAQMVKRV